MTRLEVPRDPRMLPRNGVSFAVTDGKLPGDARPEDVLLTLHAEDLAVTKRRVVRKVQVRRETRSRSVLVEEALTSTGVVVERIPVGRFVDAVPPVREEGDVTILPVVEEVVVTVRRLRLVEEVHIRRVKSTATHSETVTLRQQVVTVTRSDPVILDDEPPPAPDPVNPGEHR